MGSKVKAATLPFPPLRSEWGEPVTGRSYSLAPRLLVVESETSTFGQQSAEADIGSGAPSRLQCAHFRPTAAAQSTPKAAIRVGCSPRDQLMSRLRDEPHFTLDLLSHGQLRRAQKKWASGERGPELSLGRMTRTLTETR